MKIDILQNNLEKAKLLHKAGRIDEAIDKYRELIKIDKKNFQILYLLGTAFIQKEKYIEAVNSLKEAIKIKNDNSIFYNNLGIALSQLNENENAIKNYKKALELNPNFADAMINLGIAYKKISKIKDAMKQFNESLKLVPNNHLLHNNIGNLQRELGNADKAHKFYDKAIELKNDYIEAINNKAELYLEKKNYQQAINFFNKVLNINPNFSYTLGKLVHTKKILCDWSAYDDNLKRIIKGIKNKEKIIEPFPMLSLIDDPYLQYQNALIYNNFKFQRYERKKIILNKKINKKIKIGYYGAEFYNHPVLQLTKDIYINHDKSKFDIYGFFHGPIKDDLHYEIQGCFKKFYDINELSTDETIKLSRKLGIDIAINLTGYTANSKSLIYLNRVAPIQISFVGYSGTMGANFMDYIIGDKILIPEKNYEYYTEKVLNFPNSFFPGQKKIEVSDKKFSKESLNLPGENFIFGNFNNTYKITPDIFKVWMEILKLNKKSVLWLLHHNNVATENLKKEAESSGIDQSRIIFAKKLNYKEHLKRFGFMDLFLDTFPYNGHTTVSEAIRRGVPTLTLSGNSFASRVASSLLNSMELKILISNNIKEYISIACEMASNKEKYNSIKNKLVKNRGILFDSKKYTKDLEKIYESLVLQN